MSELQTHGPYPMTRAFVLKLHRDADLVRGALRGRIEHVASGDRGEFDGTGQLLGWLASGLQWEAEQTAPPPPQPLRGPGALPPDVA